MLMKPTREIPREMIDCGSPKTKKWDGTTGLNFPREDTD